MYKKYGLLFSNLIFIYMFFNGFSKDTVDADTYLQIIKTQTYFFFDLDLNFGNNGH